MKISSLMAAVAAVVLGAGGLSPAVVRADEDFTRYTNEELVQQRTRVRDMDQADRTRYRDEMQSRAQHMSAAERERLGIDERGAPAGAGEGRTRAGEDNDRGQGEMERERQRSESGDGYGRGYESRQGSSGGGLPGAGRGGRGR